MDMKTIKSELGHIADMVSRTKAGNYMARRGYFMRNGRTAEDFRNDVLNNLNGRGIPVTCVVYGDHWTSFRGGYKVNKQSHFYCEFKLS